VYSHPFPPQVLLRLDTSRNELLVANTAFALLACCVGFGGYIGGIFGMNLDQTIWLQEVDGVFIGVLVGSFWSMILLFCAIFGSLHYYGIIPKRVVYKTSKAIKTPDQRLCSFESFFRSDSI
jgi:hypothetical protein